MKTDVEVAEGQIKSGITTWATTLDEHERRIKAQAVALGELRTLFSAITKDDTRQLGDIRSDIWALSDRLQKLETREPGGEVNYPYDRELLLNFMNYMNATVYGGGKIDPGYIDDFLKNRIGGK